MSEYTEVKRHFRIGLVQGQPAPAPPEREARWLRQFERANPVELAAKPRLLNAFMLGADPEFVFEDVVNGVRMDAEALKLKTGLAYGADMNGRLVELRPAPSRFALEVLASILKELRFMATFVPFTTEYAWKAGAFIFKDGVGGHVHLGRKLRYREIRAWAKYFNHRNKRHHEEGAVKPPKADLPATIRALDLVMYMLTQTGVFPADQVEQRMDGDQHGQRYGLPGDIRVQAHGYEYRAFPSWMDSPWAAYLVLVLTKLAVFDPDLLPHPQKGALAEKPREWHEARIKHLLAFYKGLDDDAALAYEVLLRDGLPKFKGDCFRARWGVQSLAIPRPAVIPTCINAEPADVAELFGFFKRRRGLTEVPQINWHATLPAGFRVSLDQYETTRGLKGMGELLWDIVENKNQPVRLVCVPGDTFYVSPAWEAAHPGIAERVKRIYPKVKVDYAGEGRVAAAIPLVLREPNGLATARKILLCGAFPLWDVESVQPDSLVKWRREREQAAKPKAVQPPVEKARKFVGKVLFEQGA